MELSQVVARVALAGCFLVVGTASATADEIAAEASAQTPPVEVVSPASPSAPEGEVAPGHEAAPSNNNEEAAAQPAVVEASAQPAPEPPAAATSTAADTAAQPVAAAPAVAPVAAASAGEGSAALAQQVAVAPAAKGKSPWKGSFIAYEHAFSAVSLDKASGQTWNPYYAHSFSLQPMWRFHDYVALKLRLDVEQELTNADETVKRYEWMWSDLNVDVNAGKGFTEKVTGININGGLRLGLPVSKVSRARTMILSLAPALTISRKFPVLQGLTVAYAGRFAWQFHQSTTAEYDGTSLSCGDPDSAACERFTNTGIRNASTVLRHGPAVTLDILDNLSFEVSYTMMRHGLYDLDDRDIYDSASGIHLGTLESGENDISARYSQAFSAEIAWSPIEMVGISLGFISLYADLRDNGSHQTPLFNRFTNIYLNLSLDIDSVVQVLK